MKPRITINISENNTLEIWINESGRDALVQELLNLTERNDHLHLSSSWPAEIRLSQKKYHSTDTLIDEGKILFRKEEWDKEFYPHVLES